MQNKVKKVVTTHEAKTHFSKLLRRVSEKGEEIVIGRGNQPIAKLVPYLPPSQLRVLGQDRGSVWIADDFDAPLPTEVLEAFET